MREYKKPKVVIDKAVYDYTKFGKYIPQNLQEYAERYAFIKNYVNGNADPDFRKATMSGLPILNRYAELEYTDTEGKTISIILETLFISVVETSNIVETVIQGIDGTSKEYINKGDYVITLTGSLLGENGWTYNSDSLNQLKELMDVKGSLTINNQFLNEYFNVSSIVKKVYKTTQSPDFSNITHYEIECLSDNEENQIIVR